MVHQLRSSFWITASPAITAHGLSGHPPCRAQPHRPRPTRTTSHSATGPTHPDDSPFHLPCRTPASARRKALASDTLFRALYSARVRPSPLSGPHRRRTAPMVASSSFPENVVAAATAAGASSSGPAEAGAAALMTSTAAAVTAAAAAAAAAGAVSVLGVPVPLSWALGLTGGLIIGAAASLHLYLTGRIMGASGIVNGVLTGAPDWKWRAVFLLSLLTVAAGGLALRVPPLATSSAADAACSLLAPATWQSCSASAALSPSSWAATLLPAVAGLLVGYGSQMGSGCTSGHGVCGLPRFAIRSAVAVVTFMFTGAVASIVSASFPSSAALINRGTSSWGPAQALALTGLTAAFAATRSKVMARQAQRAQPKEAKGGAESDSSSSNQSLYLSVALSGAVFGVGLLLSGMLDRFKIRNFLDPFHGWDPSMAFVMGGAVAFNLLSFPRILARPRPACGTCFLVPSSKEVTRQLVVGAAIFGAGWGLYGLCPAPAMMMAVTGRADVILWNLSMACGMLLFECGK